jgi:ankyrin repeat protein
LIGKKSPKAIRSALKNLSTNEKYEHAYNGLMERIQGQLSDQSQLAMQVLAWITCAQRPLTTIELQTALAVEIGESEFDEDNLPDLADMVSVCAGLVTVDEQSNIIRLVHYTTQEYLERTQCVWFPEAHCDIGTSCVAYLLLDVFKEGQCRTYEGLKARFRNYPLFEYAGLFWGDHVRLYIGSNERYPSEQMAIELLGDIPRANSCMQTIIGKGFDGGFGLPIRRLKGHRGIYPRYGNTYPESTSQFTVGLHLAVYFELPQVLQTFISRGEPVDTQNACLNTPLSWAAYLGLEEIVSLLLKNGANPNAKDKMGWTPIHLAAEGGFKRVVEMLLDEDGDPMLISASGITPLHISAVYGDTSVARILLKSDMDPHLRDHAGRTSLGFASWRGYTELIELLLDCSPNVKLGSILDSSISTAAEGGHVEAMKLLLNRGADPNTTIPSELFNFWEPSGHTPIMQAAKSGMEEAVKLLLEWGVNLNLKDNRGRTALSLSIHREHADIALHLLSKGADPNSLDNSGRTALFYAPYSTSVAMVSLLTPYIEHPNQTDRYGRTPLHVAVARGNLRVVHDLLDLNGIDSEIQDIFGRTPLSDAILRQKVDVVNVLESFASGVTYEKPNSQPNEANEQATAAQSCDVCMVDIFDGHTIHYCSLCEIGCFYICELCHQAGARCHNVKHVLEKRIEDEYEVLL